MKSKAGNTRGGFNQPRGQITSLPELIHTCDGKYELLVSMLGDEIEKRQLDEVRSTK